MTDTYQLRLRPDYEKIMEWYRRFERVNKIRGIIHKQSYLYEDYSIIENRMKKLWNWVIEVEPVETFHKNGYLNEDARYILNTAWICELEDIGKLNQTSK
jgi:hypothetical protein